MSKLFYIKLAFTNIKKNSKFYIPFYITCIGTISMFYMMAFMAFNTGIENIRGSDTLKVMLSFGTVIIGLFSTIFLFYTNSFLMKRRKKEIGLYNILGMEKGHIAKVMTYETLISAVSTIVIGISTGIVLSKLLFMLLCKIVNFNVPLISYISGDAIVTTAVLFIFIFLLILISTLLKISLSKPIELLHGSNVGEKEPKTKIILAIFGFVSLALGYIIAIKTESPIQAIGLFFIAVLLVIIGTYCLFTAGSIAVLKMLRKNKKYYYKTNHFTAVSGMLYRMKQNAVGLANICILSTMVLVMVSGTVSLYLGTEDALQSAYPYDIKYSSDAYTQNRRDNNDRNFEIIKNILHEENVEIKNLIKINYISFVTKYDDSSFIPERSYEDNYYTVKIVSADEYNSFAENKITLKSGEVAIYSDSFTGNSFEMFGKTYQVKEKLDNLELKPDNDFTFIKFCFIITEGVKDFPEIAEAKINQPYYDGLCCDILIDFEATDEKKLEIYEKINSSLEYDIPSENPDYDFTYHNVSSISKQESSNYLYGMYGGFLFLGIFLGFMFTMAAVLIIYYKQISEGYDDKTRFEIMQKVGMDKTEVKKSIGSQIVLVFFLPLVTAVIHVAAAFKMITKLLSVLYLDNVALFAICTGATVVIFAIIYAIVFKLTARQYYKIVK